MDYKFLALEDFKADDDTRTIEGFASIFNNVDGGNDIVLPGAFAKTLKKKSRIKMLWQHKTDCPLGVWTDIEERDKGLYVKGQIADTAMGIDCYKLLKTGALDGLSIGYATKKYEIDQDKGIRKLTELDLYEVSLVTFPMNEKATITRVKSEDGMFMTEREFEEFLRDVGKLSQQEAKIVVSKGYKSLLTHRDGGDEAQQESDQREAAVALLKTITPLLTQFK